MLTLFCFFITSVLLSKMSDPESEQIWQQFLHSIYDDSYKQNDDEEEEVNDPEYRISEDLLNLEDDWDFSDERAFKVSDYELDLLLEEDENDVEVQTVQRAIDTTEGVADGNVLSGDAVALLVSQMAQHIQLLTQNYFQSRNTMGLQSVAENAISMLSELNKMSETNPIFRSIGLSPAIGLIGRYPIDRSIETRRVSTSWRTLPVTKENQKVFIANPNVFGDPSLLPSSAYFDQKEVINKRKTIFTLAEDHLIALGLEQLAPMFSLRKCYRYLKQLLLPNKTVDQIRTHIKNIKRRSNVNDSNENPIIYYYSNGRAPDIRSADHRSDCYSTLRTSPDWYKKAFKASASKKNTDSSLEAKRYKQTIAVTEWKRIHPTSQQSPVKQTHSIVKKYKYLNRLNHIKQNLSLTSSLSPLKKKDSKVETLSKHKNGIQSDDIVAKVSENDGVANQEEILRDISLQTMKNNDHNYPKTDSDIIQRREETNKINDTSINEEDMECDDESDLVALMTASSTITIKNKSKSKAICDSNNSVLQLSQNRKEGRKSLAAKQRESTLQLLSFESNTNQSNNSQQKEEILIENFLEKVRKCLTHDNYIEFLTLLSELNRNQTEMPSNKCWVKEIYFRIEDFLKRWDVSNDIISELVLFLNARQAEECGKMFEYLYWKRIFNFVNKVEKYSLIDGQCLSRFHRSLNQLKANAEDLDENKLRCAVSRSLNGHSYLMHHFSSLLLSEKPSKYMFDDQDFDEVVIESSDDEERSDYSERVCFENINIPENEDDLKYGTNECPCSFCHRDPSQPINNHCTSCSIRFIGGRVYLTQNHKKLGLAEIHFSDKSEDPCNDRTESKLSEDSEEVSADNDKEDELGCHQLTDRASDGKAWTMNEDKLLLELCRFKVIEEKHNDLSEDVFEEVAIRLSKETNDVIIRFNKLMEMFAAEDNHSTRVDRMASD